MSLYNNDAILLCFKYFDGWLGLNFYFLTISIGIFLYSIFLSFSFLQKKKSSLFIVNK